MRTLILSVFLLISSISFSQYFYDASGKRVARFDDDRIYDASGKFIGRIDADRIYEASGKFIGGVDGNYLFDGSGKRIGREDGLTRMQVIIYFYYFY